MADITIKEEEWFIPDGIIYPEDKELCIVLYAFGSRSPKIMQFRKPDWLCRCYQNGYFLDVTELWDMEDSGGNLLDWNPGFASFRIIEAWRPLKLPEEADTRLKKHIEQCFEEE